MYERDLTPLRQHAISFSTLLKPPGAQIRIKVFGERAARGVLRDSKGGERSRDR